MVTMTNIEEPVFNYAEDAYNYALKHNHRLNLSNEKLIATDGYYAYLYAHDVLDSKFELGEEAISISGIFSYYYACYILKSRFKLGEHEIATIEKSYIFCFFYYIELVLDFLIPVDFLELCPIHNLEYLAKCYCIKNKDDVIKVLFKKRILAQRL